MPDPDLAAFAVVAVNMSTPSLFEFQKDDIRTVRELRTLSELHPTPVLVASAELLERLLKYAYGVNSFATIAAAREEVEAGIAAVGECQACKDNQMACIGRCLMV